MCENCWYRAKCHWLAKYGKKPSWTRCVKDMLGYEIRHKVRRWYEIRKKVV